MRTEDLNIVKSNSTFVYADMVNSFMYKFRFGTEECFKKTSLLKEVVLYQWVLNTWQQYDNGEPVADVNHISTSDFNVMINRLKELTQ